MEDIKRGLEISLNNLKDTGVIGVPETFRITISNARENLQAALGMVIGEQPLQWLPEYDEIVDWLTDNGGRGLLCYGNVGRGKTLICAKAIPMLLNYFCRKVVTVVDAISMNNNIDEVKKQYLLCLDDIGTEAQANQYGNKRDAFSEIVDEAERKGHLLLITTNLTLEELRGKYGIRTLDRLRHITKCVKFKGDSLRN